MQPAPQIPTVPPPLRRLSTLLIVSFPSEKRFQNRKHNRIHRINHKSRLTQTHTHMQFNFPMQRLLLLSTTRFKSHQHSLSLFNRFQSLRLNHNKFPTMQTQNGCQLTHPNKILCQSQVHLLFSNNLHSSLSLQTISLPISTPASHHTSQM